MSDISIKQKSINLPAYINIPFFLYHDDRLDKAATLIAAFFYSLHTAGMDITASTDYLCSLANIKKRQCYYIMNLLEELGYIQRKGFTNRKKLYWVHSTKSNITVTESDTSAPECKTEHELDTSAVQCTKLVQSSALNYCSPVHTYNKVDTKDYKKLTTTDEEQKSSSSFFSLKQKAQLIKLKLSTDSRNDDEFIDNCEWHISKQENEFTKYRRFKGLLRILEDVADAGEHFKASGYYDSLKVVQFDNRIPTKEEFMQWKKCTPGYEWVGIWRSRNQA